MAFSKIILNGTTLMDLTSDTVAAANLISPNTAHDAAGLAITGTATAGVTPSGTISITSNGSHDVTQYASANVNVPTGSTVNNQNKTVTPTQSQQSITADSGYTGLGIVMINAISDTYVGSAIDRNSSSNLSVNGATVTAPAGYYAEAASTSVASGSAATPASTITVTPGISVSSAGLITATASGSKNITPTVSVGYVSTGTAGTVTVNGSNTSQLSTQAGTTITPSQTLQTAVAAGKYTTGAVTVAAIPNDYIGSGITQRDETDLTASGATVTVPAGYYASQQTKSIVSGSAATPASTITANPSISVNSSGLITATVSGSKSITPTVSAGYVSAGTAGTVTVSGSDTSQLTTLGATTYNTSTTNQTISSGRYITGTQTIRAVTTSGITAANIKAGTTVSVGDSADADRILSVTGTFTSDATAAASDIVSGQTAYVNGSKVTGSLVVQTYYTGSSAPSSSLGVNGDIYIQA